MIYFNDEKHQRAFVKDGFIAIDLLDKDDVDKLRDFYFENKNEHLAVKTKMHSTCDTNHHPLIERVDIKIKEVVLPVLNKILKSYESLLGVYLVKEPGDDSETGFHQDPTLVDGSNFVSANVWIPLQDTNSHNGNLRVIKGSHRLGEILVVTPAFPTIFESFKDDLLDYATEIPVKTGQAIILDNKLIHGATANHSRHERLAVVIAIKSVPAKWSFYFLEPGNEHDKIEQYSIDTFAFSKLEKDHRPSEGKFIGYRKHHFVQLNKKEFEKFMYKNYKSEYFFRKLKHVIKK